MLIEKKSSILLVISNILMLGLFIITLILRTTFIYSLFWFALPVLIIVNLIFINLWTKNAVNPDNNKSKSITRSTDDITIVSTVIYAFIYLIIIFIDMVKDKITFNLYVIIAFYLLTIIYELISVSSIVSANKETKELIEKYNLGK